MSSAEMALVARVLRTGEIQRVLEFGITLDDFLGTEAKAYWRLILTYYMQPGTVGSVLNEQAVRNSLGELAGNVVLADWPTYTVEALCIEVRKSRICAEALSGATDLADQIKIDPSGAIQRLTSRLQHLTALGVRGNTDVTMSSSLDRILQRMDLMESGVDFSVMKWPWEVMNEATAGGLQEDDYIVFYGRPKSMKTWLLCYLLAWAFEQGKRILVYTKEMTPDNVFRRTSSCICRLPYDDVRGARLSYEQKQALRDLRTLDADPTFPGNIICLSGRDAPPGGDTVSWVEGKIDNYKPDLVFIDGIYLLSDEPSRGKAQADHTRVMNISRGLRQMNLRTRIPLITTMQANRKAAGHSNASTDEIAYSDALGQDATIAARVIADKNTPTISVVMAGSREFRLHGFRINAVPARDFSFHSVLTEKDALQAKELDVEEEEAAAVKKAAKKAANGKRQPQANGASPVATLINQQLAGMGLS